MTHLSDLFKPEWEFVLPGFYAGLVVAALCAYLGVFVVLKRIVFVGAALAVAGVVVVALPFLREPTPESDALHELDAAERERLEAEEARDRALAALKELEADHRAGRISDEDYRAVVGILRRDAAEALRELDRVRAMTQEGTRTEGAKSA